MTEEWRDIPSTDSRFSISNMGRVRKNATGQILKPNYEKGYAEVDLRLIKGKKPKNRKVSHLVRDVWLPEIPKNVKIKHKNKNITDCSADNLTYNKRKGRGKFTDKQIIRIKRDIALGERSQNYFAKKYKVDRKTIKRIVDGVCYADVTVQVNPREKGIITERSTHG